ncbi:MAG: zf-HC2 domain-containing protein [Chloroflexi bacterium]|nr:MAG: zf-HC2 domain-containing protein [Chloroflexota bacterium]
MGCDDVKRVLYFFLDGALGERKRRSVNDHLSLCPDCERRTRLHRRLRDLVQRRLTRVPASDRFKIRLTRSLRVFHVEW